MFEKKKWLRNGRISMKKQTEFTTLSCVKTWLCSKRPSLSRYTGTIDLCSISVRPKQGLFRSHHGSISVRTLIQVSFILEISQKNPSCCCSGPFFFHFFPLLLCWDRKVLGLLCLVFQSLFPERCFFFKTSWLFDHTHFYLLASL